jgi:hypothetical protein
VDAGGVAGNNVASVWKCDGNARIGWFFVCVVGVGGYVVSGTAGVGNGYGGGRGIVERWRRNGRRRDDGRGGS